MIFTTKKNTRPNLNLQIQGHIVDETCQTKFFGVIIDSNLTLKQHIMYISETIAKGIGIIKRQGKYLTRKLWLLYIILLFIIIYVIVIMFGEVLVSHI